MNRGTNGVNSLPKTVTRQRRGCDLNLGPSASESSTLTTRLLSHLRRVKTVTLKRDCLLVLTVQQQNAMALGDFIVFLTRIASVAKVCEKMAASKWTSSLLKMVGYCADSGEPNCFKL